MKSKRASAGVTGAVGQRVLQRLRAGGGGGGDRQRADLVALGGGQLDGHERDAVRGAAADRLAVDPHVDERAGAGAGDVEAAAAAAHRHLGPGLLGRDAG
ncbi:MAG: hypothetical protein R3F65_18020 [bacterium]